MHTKPIAHATLLIFSLLFARTLLFAPPGDALYQAYSYEKRIADQAPSQNIEQKAVLANQFKQRAHQQEASDVQLPEEHHNNIAKHHEIPQPNIAKHHETPQPIQKILMQHIQHAGNLITDGFNRAIEAIKSIFYKPAQPSIAPETKHERLVRATNPKAPETEHEKLVRATNPKAPETEHEKLVRATNPETVDYPIFGPDSDDEDIETEATRAIGNITGYESDEDIHPYNSSLNSTMAQGILTEILREKKVAPEDLELYQQKANTFIETKSQADPAALIKKISELLQEISKVLSTIKNPKDSLILDNPDVKKILGLSPKGIR